MIRTLIVDDEPLARERLRELLADEPDVEVVGEQSDGCQAVIAIHDRRPDLIFLDVQLPNLNGFQILESVRADGIPTVVFTTAYEDYALRAFDMQAVDYLLKPFGRERLERTLRHVREQISRERSGDLSRQFAAFLEENRPSQYRYLRRIMIKENGRLFFLRTPDIDWLESARNHVRLHVGTESHLHREPLKGLERRLDPEMFVRIHRSAIVNIERIKELRPSSHGDYIMLLRDGLQFTMSASYREKRDDLRGRTRSLHLQRS